MAKEEECEPAARLAKESAPAPEAKCRSGQTRQSREAWFLSAGDRGFESLFLQRGVSCEPDSQGPGFKRLVPPAGTIAQSCATDPTLHQVVRLGSGWHV